MAEDKKQEFIEIRGARENNLKDVTLRIPKRKITVFTGVSGSGKSSIVFDTIATEAQRALDNILSRCAADEACNERFPELGDKFALLRDRLDDAPVSVELQDPTVVPGKPNQSFSVRTRVTLRNID